MSGTTTSRGKFTARLKGYQDKSLIVDFNPASLKLTITNTLQDDKPGGEALQNVRKSATKLEMELVFDTTETGADVRNGKTVLLKKMGRPPTTKGTAIPQVTFEWGAFSFTGVIESMQETLDFFSAEGVPLRSTVQLTMQSLALDAITPPPKQEDPKPSPAVAQPPPAGLGTTKTATQAGNSGAGRLLAAANALESMRFTDGAGLAVDDTIPLGGPVGFSTSLSAGADMSVGAGFSAGAGGSAGASFGASASAGVSASAGAFAGLGVSKTFSAGALAGAAGLSPDLLRPPVDTLGVSANAGASFDLTGKVVATQSSGLQADVGAAGASARLRVI